LPDEVLAIAETDRAKRAKFDSDLCFFDERCFIRCLLEVPFTDRDGYFGWGIWVEVSRPSFERYNIKLYADDAFGEPWHDCRIANNISAYGMTLGVEARMRFRGATDRPSVHLLAEDPSMLAREQRHGINSARYHVILDALV
jgi:hypothetical protein